jgi:hypothetical protein
MKKALQLYVLGCGDLRQYEMCQSKFRVLKPRFDPRASRIGNRKGTCLTATFGYRLQIPSHVPGFLFVSSVFRKPIGSKQSVAIFTVSAGDAVICGPPHSN